MYAIYLNIPLRFIREIKLSYISIILFFFVFSTCREIIISVFKMDGRATTLDRVSFPGETSKNFSLQSKSPR